MKGWTLVLIAAAGIAGWWWWRRRQAMQAAGLAPGLLPGSSTVAAVATFLTGKAPPIPGTVPTPMPAPAATGVIPPQIVNAPNPTTTCPKGTKRAYQGGKGQGSRPVCVPN